MPESLDKKKPTPDVVLLLDATSGMGGSLKGVAASVAHLLESLACAEAAGTLPIEDWRIRVMAYRDRESDGSQWLVDTPFTSDSAQVLAHVSGLQAIGGGDEPESLYDALYGVSQWPGTPRGMQPAATAWRHPDQAPRIVVIVTDGSCKPHFQAANGPKGALEDLLDACMASRLKVILYAPEAPCYIDLSVMNDLEWEPVGQLDESPVPAMAAFWTEMAQDKDYLFKVLIGSACRARAIPGH